MTVAASQRRGSTPKMAEMEDTIVDSKSGEVVFVPTTSTVFRALWLWVSGLRVWGASRAFRFGASDGDDDGGMGSSLT